MKKSIIKSILLLFAVFSFTFNSSSQCTYSVCIYDTWGDGWDVASLSINLGGTWVVSGMTLASGSGPSCQNFTVNNGQSFTVYYYAGSFPTENYYAIFMGPNGTGTQIYNSGSGSTPPGTNPITANNPCNVAPPPGDNFCAGSSPFCTGTTYVYPLNTNTSAEAGPNYVCLGSQPNPVWYYLLIDQPGPIEISMTAPNDVDFIAWGPFSSQTGPCTAQLTAPSNPGSHWSPGPGGGYPVGNTIDCSFDASNQEWCYIPNGQTGQYYILLITNYANVPQDVTFSQTGGTGTTNCNIVQCDMTNITVTPSACASNLYSASGQIFFTDPPSYAPIGTLVVTDQSSGQSVTLNPPFNSPMNYTIPGITADGVQHTITAYFTSAPTCTYTITYNAPPPCTSCSVNAGPNQNSVCGLTTNLAALAPGGYTNYHWDPVGGIIFGNINSNTSSITASASGTYTFTWWGTTNPGGLTCSDQVNVTFVNPVAGFTYNGNQCLTGNSFNFTNTGTSSGATYSWSFAGGTPATSTAQNPSNITFSTAGPHNVTQTVTIGSCSATYNQTVTVYGQPTVTITPTNVACFGACNGSAIAAGSGGSGVYTYLWSTGSTSTNVSSLCPGNVSNTVTDSYGCTGSATVNITQPAALVLTATRTDPTCNGSCNGTANVTVAGGIGPFTYLWSNSATTQSISGLCAGTYTVTVTDNAPGNPPGGCTQTANVVLTNPSSMVLTGSFVNATCGANNGSATVTVNSGGGPNYLYNWSNGINFGPAGATTHTNPNVGAGAYTVTVTSNGCTATTVVNVGSSGAPTATITSSVNPTCFGLCNGQATVSLGGTLNPPYTYSWSTGTTTSGSMSTTNTANNLCNGTTTVNVTDNMGCVASASVTVTQPTAVVASTTTVNASCGQSNGSATANPSGGAGGYTYSWQGGQTTQTAVNLAPGIYGVTVTDISGCSVITSATVSNTAGVTASIFATTIVGCNGGNNGTATAAGAGGSLPYSYQWPASAGNQVTATATNLAAGSYTVTMTDNSGCTSTATAVITQPTAVTATITASTNALCFGVCNGTATAAGGGGTPGYTYSWSNGGSAALTTGLCAGSTYTVTVRDANLCTATTTVTVSQPTQVTVTAISTNSNCGASNGTATANPGGGTPGFTYLWTGGQTTQTATGLAAGSYFVTVYDANNCTAVTSVVVGNTAGGTASISATVNTSCNGACDGSATVSMGGGAMPFIYSWSSGSTSVTAPNLCAGPVTVTVTDANSCTSIASTNITQPAVLSVNLTLNDVNCFGDCSGSLIATPAGGTPSYSFIWSNSIFVPNNTNLCAGSYTVTVTDNQLCTATATQSISSIPPITLSATSTPANCNQSNGSLTLTVTNGSPPFTYVWSPAGSGPNLTNIPAGSYSVTVTDTKGCTATGTFNVSNLSGPVASISSSTNVSCNSLCDGIATGSVASGTPPFIYTWSNGQSSVTATNLCAGVFTFSVTDNASCIATASVTITQPTALSIVSLTGTSPNCNADCNGAASVIASGGTTPYQYSWSGGAPFGGLNPTNATTTGICNGTMIINITDDNGCTTTGNVQIIEPPFLSLTTAYTNPSCNGVNDGTATVFPSGGTPNYTYQWSANTGGQTTSTATGLGGGTYSVVVTDSKNCTETVSVILTSPSALVFSNITPTHLPCNNSNNGSIAVTVTGGTPSYGYVWTNQLQTYNSTSQNISNLPADTYFLTVTDQNNCSITTTVIISQPPQLTLSLNKTDETCYQFCDGSIQSNVAGGQAPISYLWSNTSGTPNISNLCPGTYILTVTDNNGCSVTLSETINGNPLLQIDLVSTTPASCGVSNGSAQISFQGGLTGYSIQWSTGGNSVIEINMPAGNHTVSVIDQNGCIATLQVPIQNLNGPVITNITSSGVTCAGANDGVAIVSYSPSNPPAPPYISTWSNSWVGDTASGLSGGMYYVTVVDAVGCQAVSSVVVSEPTQFVSVINSTVHNQCYGNCYGSASVLAGGGTQPYSYNWLGIGQTTPTAFNLCVGIYTVAVQDANGCTSVNQVTINEPPALSATGTVTDVQCNGYSNGVISVTVTGGTPVYSYNWLPPASGTYSVISNLSAGTFSVLITDVYNCTLTETFTLNEPLPLQAYLSSQPATCGFNNGIAWVDSVTGGTSPYSLLWTPGNSTNDSIYNLTGGIYQVQITDANSCNGYLPVAVNTIASPSSVTFVTTPATCPGTFTGTATATSVGGTAPFTYQWSDNQTTQTAANLSAGNYLVTITDKYGCTVMGAVTVTQPNPIVVLTSGSDSICMGAFIINITANATGGTSPYTYEWTGPDIINPNSQSQFVSPDSTTNYFVIVYDNNGCVSPVPGVVTVYVYPPITATISSDAVICEGGSYPINVTAWGGMPPYQYVWNLGTGNPNIATPTDTTTYIVQVFDQCGTPPATAQMTINVQQAPDIINDPIYQSGCVEYLADFNVIASVSTGNISYNWNFGDPSSGDNTSTLQNPAHLYTLPGSYDITLTLTSDYGCSYTQTYTNHVQVNPIPDASFNWSTPSGEKPTVLNGEVNFITQAPSANGVTWFFGDGSNSASAILDPTYVYTAPGIYEVLLIVTINGCVDTAMLPVQIYEDFTLWVPTAFTPGSGISDGYFYPKGKGFDQNQYYFAIFDRWGQVIFETIVYPEGTDMKPEDIRTKGILDNSWIPGGWNGGMKNDKSKLVPVGTYTWFIRIRDNINGELHEESGPVTVIR